MDSPDSPLAALESELETLRHKLERLSPLGIKWRLIRCGKPACRCAQGDLHGPYPYLRVKRDGKWCHQYLGKGWQPPEGFCRPREFRALLREYRRLLEAAAILRSHHGTQWRYGI